MLVVSKPEAPYLKWLSELPADTHYVVGNTIEKLAPLADSADVIVYCMTPGLPLKEVWNIAPRVQWIHSLSAGLESILFPALAESTVPMTNSRGVFKESLGEFVIAECTQTFDQADAAYFFPLMHQMEQHQKHLGYDECILMGICA